MDSYGCVNFNPRELPEGELEETLLIKVNEFKIAFQTGKQTDVKIYMKPHIRLQRRVILSEKYTIQDLKNKWPF